MSSPHASSTSAPPAAGELAYPLDGCAIAPLGSRFLAYLLDSLIATLVMLPLSIGSMLMLTREEIGVLPLVLVGIGAALPLAYHLFLTWLMGAKGLTVGWLATGLRLVSFESGEPIGFWRSLGRYVLFWLFPLLFALSLLWDPQKTRRGWHDRPVGAILLDRRRGRDPIRPRPDEFERPPAEHYMPAGSVEVGAHANLLTETGSPWRSEHGAQHSPSAAPTGWEPAPAAYQDVDRPAPASPGVAIAGGAPQGLAAESAYAPGLGAEVPQAPAASDELPGSAPSAPRIASAETYAPPAADPMPEAGYPLEPQPVESGQPRRGVGAPWPSAAAATAAPPTVHEDEDQASASRPAPAVQAAAADVPADLEEETRVASAGNPLGDLEATRVSTRGDAEAIIIELDDGTRHACPAHVVIGRNPVARAGEHALAISDATRSISKTHLRVEWAKGELYVTDLGSTNGSAVFDDAGETEPLVAHAARIVPSGARIMIGDRTVHVERNG